MKETRIICQINLTFSHHTTFDIYLFQMGREGQVDFEGPSLTAEVRQIRSQTNVVFRVDKMNDRIDEAENQQTLNKSPIVSPKFEVKFKRGEGKDDGLLKFFIKLVQNKEEKKNEERSTFPVKDIGLYMATAGLMVSDDVAVKLEVRIRGILKTVEMSIVHPVGMTGTEFGWENLMTREHAFLYLGTGGSLTIEAAVTVIVDSEIPATESSKSGKDKGHNLLDDLKRADFPTDSWIISADGLKIPCTKAILASRSKKLKELLLSDSFKDSKLEMNEFQSGCLKCFWYFCFTDSIDVTEALKIHTEKNKVEPPPKKRGRPSKRTSSINRVSSIVKPAHEDTNNVSIVRNLLHLANKYDISSLKTKASCWLMDKVNPDNALDTLKIAVEVDAEDLVKYVVDVIVRNRGNKNFDLENIKKQNLSRDIYELIMKAFW